MVLFEQDEMVHGNGALVDLHYGVVQCQNRGDSSQLKPVCRPLHSVQACMTLGIHLRKQRT